MTDASGPSRRVMAVRTDVVARVLVNDLHRAARARIVRSAPPSAEAVLERTGEVVVGAKAAGDVAAHQIARVGYEVRAVELERFEPAREPVAWLSAEVAEADGEDAPGAAGVVAEIAGRLARAEPAGRPSPDDPDAVSWRIPGPGGHVRHLLAMRAAEEVESPGLNPAERKRCWIFGFLARCCEEARGRAQETPGGPGGRAG